MAPLYLNVSLAGDGWSSEQACKYSSRSRSVSATSDIRSRPRNASGVVPMLDAKATLHAWMSPSVETSSDGCVKRSAGTAKVSMGVRAQVRQEYPIPEADGGDRPRWLKSLW